MKISFLRVLHSRRRPLVIDLLLALIPLLLWFLGDCWQADLAASRERFELIVAAVYWHPQLLWAPLALAGIGLLSLGLRQHFLPRAPATRRLRWRLPRVAAITTALLSLRLLSLWTPLLHLCPFLSLLWTPHATWTLGLFHLLYLSVSFSPTRATAPSTHRRIAWLLFLGALLVYGAYTLYYCQTTMLHGDEGQYLRVTQSLWHDGDMDLANNLTPGYTDEFHVLPFGLDRAPASPPGRVHSVHPIGLSALLLPAYGFGLAQWTNPRLATALFMVLMAAGCLPLAYLWLVRLRLGRSAALAGVLALAGSAPFVLFANQLFPEVPALCITFGLLYGLAGWQVPGGDYRSWGRWAPLGLGGWTLLLGFLPFLHPRYAPLSVLGGLLLVGQAWHEERRGWAMGAIGLSASLSLGGLLAYHYAYSGDWLGPFRPGNAWAAGALDVTTWAISLPGHWLSARKGLLHASPLFFFALVGAVDLARRRDRRGLVLLLVYGSTAAVNGLHDDWEFGFCYPARYLVTALPALLLGLAWILPVLARRGTVFLLAVFSGVIGLDTVQVVVQLPELGFDGRGLLERSLNRFYPWQAHFFPPDQTGVPWFDLGFWGLLLGTASLLLVYRHRVRGWRRVGLLVGAVLLPFLWGQSAPFVRRLSSATILFPYFLNGEEIVHISADLEYPLYFKRHETEGEPGGIGFTVRSSGREWGQLASASIQVPLRSGLYHLRYPDLRIRGTPGQVVGHLLLSRRLTVPAVSPWAEYISWPLVAGSSPDAYASLPAFSRDLAMGYAQVEFSGYGQFSIAPSALGYTPVLNPPDRIEVARFPLDAGPDSAQVSGKAHIPELDPGLYTARFVLSGSAFTTFFQRRPASVLMAAYTAPVSVDGDADLFEEFVEWWLQEDRESFSVIKSASFVRPQVEVVQAPWWLAVPGIGSQHYEFDFLLLEPRRVWLLLRYAGELDLQVEEIILYKREMNP